MKATFNANFNFHALILLLLGAAALPSNAQESVNGAVAATPSTAQCKYVKVGEIPFTIERNVPLLTGEVNGVAARFVLDTGAAMTSVFQNYVEKNAWPLGQADTKLIGVGGTADTYTMLAKNVAIDKIKRSQMRLRVLGQASDYADGLVGADFLMQRDLELDLAARKIRFFQALDASSCKKGFLAYWDENASSVNLLSAGQAADLRPLVEVTLNGKKLRALLDTGSARTLVNMKAARELGMQATANPAQAHISGIGKSLAKAYPQQFTLLTIGNEELKDPTFGVVDLWGNAKNDHNTIGMSDMADSAPDMILGMDVLYHFRILVAHSQAKLYISSKTK